MAWKPLDEEAFRSSYLQGTTNIEFAEILKAEGASHEKVQRYVRREVKEGRLPHRDNFIPSKPDTKISDELILEAKLKARLQKSQTNISVLELSNELDVSPRRIEMAIHSLQAQNYLIELDGDVARASNPAPGLRTEMLTPYNEGNRFRFGFVTDAHLCSKYALLDRLHLFYQLAYDKGVRDFFDAGNWIDGEARFNKTDLNTHGMDNQIKYWAENWPKHEGVTTRFVAGDDHEGWYQQREGIEIGRHAQAIAHDMGRKDLIYLGYMEHDVVIPAPNGETVIRVQHPGGGSAYALSYTPQKIVESLSGGDKPNILLLGHYHKAGHWFLRNIHTVLGGCFQAQSPFMRKKRLAAHVGGWIIEFLQGDTGDVLEFTSTFIPFYDVSAHEKWEYKM
jgi:hypothetical protein